MKIGKGKTIILLLLSFCTYRSAGQTFDYNTVMDKIRSDEWGYGLESASTLDNWVAEQESNGSWSEFQYGLILQSGSNKHVRRLWSLARACTNANHPKYNNEAYKAAVKNGLEYWKASNSIDVNWWYLNIDWPKKLGAILILMREFPEYIPQDTSAGIDEPEVISLFQPTSINALSSQGEGANMLDFGLHYIYRGVLKEDSVLLMSTSEYLNAHFLTHIQSDMSFHEHGPQLHISSYGLVYTQAMVQLAWYLSGSPAAFDSNGTNFAFFLQFVRDIQLPSIRGQYWDFSVLGRGVSRRNASRAGISFAQRLASDIDTDNAFYYQNTLDRVSGLQYSSYHAPVYHRHYWESDYTQHARANYLFNVRSVSRQTVESETGNGENLKANYFSYGANFISVDGDEYYNIMPVWDWSMIPGITFKHTESFPNRTNWGVNFGNTRFVGGISDGMYGASVLDLNKHGLKAKKSWFFFDEEIVCLGAGIFDVSGKNVRTTLNQCLAEGNAYYSTSGLSEITVPLTDTEHYHSDLQWIRQDKVAYFFPRIQEVRFTHGNQSGNWNDINHSQLDETITEEVFKLWIDHGYSPDDGSYEYIVVPGMNTFNEAEGYNVNSISILSNSDSTQAVYHSDLDICQAVFHAAGELAYDNTIIEVNKPCVIMLQNDSILSLADPTQLLSDITYTITIDGVEYSEKVYLPSGNNMEGSTISVPLQNGVVTSTIHSIIGHNFSLYPNPVGNSIVLDLGSIHPNISATVFNAAGQAVFFKKPGSIRILTLEPDISPGLYYLQIRSDEWEATMKFVKD